MRWRESFEASSKLASELGYDLPFRRMWRLYLAYVEAGFRERRIGDVQMLLAKPGWREPLVAPSSSAPRLAAEHPVRDQVHQEAGPARGQLGEGDLAARSEHGPVLADGL